MIISPRVWIRSATTASTAVSIPCPFGTSVFDTLLHQPSIHDTELIISHRNHYDRTIVDLKEDPAGIITLDGAGASEKDSQPEGTISTIKIPMGRARECPSMDSTPCPTTLVATEDEIVDNDEDATTSKRKYPWVRLAVVGLVLDSSSSDRRLLMTRRLGYMRSFPGAWVLPGGTVDPNESLVEAVRTEALEETGLETTDAWMLESVWESVYPTVLSMKNDDDGTPPSVSLIQVHHLVVYLSTLLPPDANAQQQSTKFQLCAEEVDGAVWLSRRHIQDIITHYADKKRDTKQSDDDENTISELYSGISLDLFHRASPLSSLEPTASVPLQELKGIYPQPLRNNSHPGGMAQGSLFALEEFMGRNTLLGRTWAQ